METQAPDGMSTASSSHMRERSWSHPAIRTSQKFPARILAGRMRLPPLTFPGSSDRSWRPW